MFSNLHGGMRLVTFWKPPHETENVSKKGEMLCAKGGVHPCSGGRVHHRVVVHVVAAVVDPDLRPKTPTSQATLSVTTPSPTLYSSCAEEHNRIL